MEIYVDVILFENTIVNLFLLLLSVKLLRYKYRTYGLYFAAVFGGIYTLAIITENIFFTSIFIKVLVPMIMFLILLGERGFKKIIVSTIVFFCMSFTLSGLCFALALSRNTYEIGNNFIISNFSIKSLILALMVFSIVIIRIIDYIRERAVINNFTYDIYMKIGDKPYIIKGYLDTGNELREPVTNLPCIIVDNGFLRDEELVDYDTYYIKYKTISNDGLIKGFKLKNIRIKNEEDHNWMDIEAIICECETKLSQSGDYQALLSRGIV